MLWANGLFENRDEEGEFSVEFRRLGLEDPLEGRSESEDEESKSGLEEGVNDESILRGDGVGRAW